MPRRTALSDQSVARLKPGPKVRTVADGAMLGLYVRVQVSGAASYVVVARDPYGKQIWATLGRTGVLRIAEARARAAVAMDRIRQGLPAREEPPVEPDSFGNVAANWIKRHVEPKGLRTAKEIKRVLNRYILPKWAARDIASLRRSDVTALIDHVQDTSGPRMADVVLSTVSRIFHFHAARSDDFIVPLARGMRRETTAERARSRILTDEELRAVWSYCEQTDDAYARAVRLALLCGQRREKIGGMHWGDLDGDVWRIRAEPREKGNGGELALPPVALALIRAQPCLASDPRVFRITNWSKDKANMDAALPKMSPWRFHDLRRSARSLLQRAGVQSEVAESLLGHTRPGVEGTYARHDYKAEKGVALAKLARLIESIVRPPVGNVVPLRIS